MIAIATRDNLDSNERAWFRFVTTTRNKGIRRTEAEALAHIQETRDYNEAHKTEFEALADSDGAKIARAMYEVAGTLD